MSTYLLIRNLHIGCVFATVTLFLLRWLLQISGVDWRLRWPVLRWLPHVNDSLLLGAGLTLMLMSQQYPDADHPWLTGKLILLLAYIAAGRQALRQNRSRLWSTAWFLVASACLAGILTLAVTRPLIGQGPGDICHGQRTAEAAAPAPAARRDLAALPFHVEYASFGYLK